MAVIILDISPASVQVIRDGYIAEESAKPLSPDDRALPALQIVERGHDKAIPLTEDQIAELHRKYRL
jgi:hypothetical protein